MLQESRDLVAEADALHAFLSTLKEDDWSRPTAFQRWTPWDVVAHLHFYDQMSLAALAGRDAFAARRDVVIRAARDGVSNAELARSEYGELAPAALLERWIRSCRDMAERLGASDPKGRLPWFGPDMGVRMFTTARLMETWAGLPAPMQRMSSAPRTSSACFTEITVWAFSHAASWFTTPSAKLTPAWCAAHCTSSEQSKAAGLKPSSITSAPNT